MVAVIVGLLLITIFILPFFWFPYVFLVAATVVFAVLFLPWRRVARSPLPPDALQKHLVFQLRREGLRVEEDPEGTKVRLGSVAALRFRISPVSSGSELRYQPYATPSGWGTLITLLILAWTSLIGAVAVFYVERKARRFARDRLGALVTAADSLPPPPPDDIRVLLVHSLSEGHRIASEAYEAQRSNLGDTVALIAVSGVGVWALALFGLFFGLAPESPWHRWAALLGLATAVAFVVTLGLEWAAWRRFRPRLRESRSWAERLQLALARETAREPPAAAEPSNVELLMDLSREIPAWLRMRRRAGLSGDQAAGWVVFILASVAFMAFSLALEFAFMSAFLYAVPAVLGGTGSAVAAYVYWARWRETQERAMASTLDEWGRRTETLRSRLDRFLEDL